MAIDPVQNKTLHEVWDIDEKLVAGEAISDEEKELYNSNLQMIKDYYSTKSAYWATRNPIE